MTVASFTGNVKVRIWIIEMILGGSVANLTLGKNVIQQYTFYEIEKITKNLKVHVYIENIGS
jgi:hypothetical protein